MSIWKKPSNLSSQSKRADKASKTAKQVSGASTSGGDSDGDMLTNGRVDAQRGGNTYDDTDPTSDPELTHGRTKIAKGINKRGSGSGSKSKFTNTKSAM